MPTPSTLGKRIAQARRELGVREHRDVTQLDLARAIGTTSASISEWEADKKQPREPSLVKLAKYLRVSPAYLRYGIEPPVAPMDHEQGARAYLEANKKAAPHKAARKRGA